MGNLFYEFYKFIKTMFNFTGCKITIKNRTHIPLSLTKEHSYLLYFHLVCIGKNPVIGRSPLASLFI
jgi:hypothetical protein